MQPRQLQDNPTPVAEDTDPALTGSSRSGGSRGEDRTLSGLARKFVGGVCPESCGGLAGGSPVGVVAKRPCSWWPAEGET